MTSDPYVAEGEDLMRRRWLVAIGQLGPAAAAEDGAKAFAERMGCTLSDGRAMVRRAWQMLGLKPLPNVAGS